MGDPLGSFPRERASEDKACWKDSCWYVGTVGQIWDVTCKTYNQIENHALISYELDLLQEKRDLAALGITSYKKRSERYFNSKVKERRFEIGKLVLIKVLPNTREINAGTLGPNWEGPYVINAIL